MNRRNPKCADFDLRHGKRLRQVRHDDYHLLRVHAKHEVKCPHMVISQTASRRPRRCIASMAAEIGLRHNLKCLDPSNPSKEVRPSAPTQFEESDDLPHRRC